MSEPEPNTLEIDEVSSLKGINLAFLSFYPQAKVSGENGEIYLFQWLCSTEKAIERVSMVDILSHSQPLCQSSS